MQHQRSSVLGLLFYTTAWLCLWNPEQLPVRNWLHRALDSVCISIPANAATSATHGQ
jgi:hypothetical protein